MFGQLLQMGRRMTLAARAGMQAAMSTYREDSISLTNYAYGDWRVRFNRYDVFDFYAYNTIYTDLNRSLQTFKADHKLYKHIRGIYNPVNRLIKLEAAKTYGGQIDWTGGLRTGAIPVEGADDRLIDAIIQVLKWSNFGTQKTPLVYQGAKYGDVFLKVIDDVERSRVRLEVLDARDVKECEFDAVGNIKRIVIQYQRVEKDETGNDRVYTYREEIDQQWFRTYKDDHLFAYFYGPYTDSISGLTDERPLAQWPNLYGFVPVRHIPHMKGAGSWGMTSFQTSLGKINQLNDALSVLNDGIRKTVDPVWALIGGRMPSGAGKDEDAPRDQIPVINIPAGGDIKPLIATLDIAGAMQAVDQMIREITLDMPQLSLQDVRNRSGDTTGVAIRNGYADAEGLLIEVQGNYDQGFISAIQMAITVGALRYPTNRTAYAAFAGYDPVTSYQSGELDFYIKERDIFSDGLTEDRRIQLLLEAANNPARKLVFRRLGVSEEDIEEIEEDAQEQIERGISAGVREAARRAGMDTDEDEMEDETVEEEAVNG